MDVSYERTKISVREHRRKTGGGGASAISVLFCVLSGIFYFKIENFPLRGQANFC